MHTALAPRPRSGWQAGVIPPGSRVAAALVLLYPIRRQVHLVLTRRAGTLDQHAGQVSLPGGAVDGDEMSGSVEIGSFGSRSFTAKRVVSGAGAR